LVSLKKPVGKIKVHGTTIQFKIFLILLIFLSAQASVQLYAYLWQEREVTGNMRGVLEKNLAELDELLSTPLTDVEKEQAEEMDVIRRLVVESLNHMMLTGNADIAGDWIDGLNRQGAFIDLAVYRADGKSVRRAFRDNATINDVNKRLGDVVFERRRSAKAKLFDRKHMEQFKEAVEDGKYSIKTAKVAEAIIRKAIEFNKNHRYLA